MHAQTLHRDHSHRKRITFLRTFSLMPPVSPRYRLKEIHTSFYAVDNFTAIVRRSYMSYDRTPPADTKNRTIAV